MKIEDAIRILHPETTRNEIEQIESERKDPFKAVEEACIIACDAMKRNIPKPVVVTELRKTEWGSRYRCPECEAELVKVEFMRTDGSEPKNKVSYCWHCGQAIDWRCQND